jgi:glycosyltransferase involved in cell wall biosynthesis
MNKIDVLLPVYNGQQFLKESIESVLAQEDIEFKLYICNDCSTDNSASILAEYSNDSRVTIINNERNYGLFPTLNKLIVASSAPLFHLWAQDDIMHPAFLKTAVQFHHDYPKIAFSYCATQIIDDKGNKITNSFIDYTPELISKDLHDKIALFTGSITGNICNVTLSRAKVAEVGNFDETMKMSGDFDLWIKLTAHHSIGRINRKLISLRNHNNQLSRQVKKKYYSSLEDLYIYDRLLARLNNETKLWGKQYFYKIKLNYYFYLAVRLLQQGEIKLGLSLMRAIHRRKNLLSVAVASLKQKLSVPKVYSDNRFLFD